MARVKKEEHFEVLPENWQALEIFLQCQTQWHYAPMGLATGLNYQSLEVVMRMNNVDATEIFPQVRWIELGALNEMAKKR